LYFSSYSKSWIAHCEKYVDNITKRFKLNSGSKVVELASNDGYLLQFFKDRKIPQLGIEPTRSHRRSRLSKGIKTLVRFFGEDCAKDVVREEGKPILLSPITF